jgi:hypothetical protein
MKNEKRYDIYLKNKCLYHSLTKSEFEKTWKMLNNFISIFGNANKEDLNYKEIFSRKAG